MLSIKSVSKSFEEADAARSLPPVLDAVSFEVPEGQFLSLLGPSGCGKTTLLRIVGGLTKADSGAAFVGGREVKRPGHDCSIVFQNYGLLPWRTVMGNVEFGLQVRGMGKTERREICRHHIQRVGLSGYENYYPHEISGGMQQRVALARAFSKNPKVLLMDEPFGAVDMQTREHLQDELLQICAGIDVTVVFVTHSIDEAIYLGDRVIVMGARPGRINADIMTELPRPRSESEVKSSARYAEVQKLVRAALGTKSSRSH